MTDCLHMTDDNLSTSKQLEHFVRLKSVLLEMGDSLGLNDLSEREIRTLCAVVQLREARKPGETVGTDELREHPFCRDLSQPSFYRSLQTLTEKGILKRTGERAKTLRYTVGV
jgi:hypothetical protein